MNGVLWRSLRASLTRPMARQMASHPTGEELGLTGWKYYFNSETIVGRRNVSSHQMITVFNSPFYAQISVILVLWSPGQIFNLGSPGIVSHH